jgi:hypothetical protein
MVCTAQYAKENGMGPLPSRVRRSGPVPLRCVDVNWLGWDTEKTPCPADDAGGLRGVARSALG